MDGFAISERSSSGWLNEEGGQELDLGVFAEIQDLRGSPPLAPASGFRRRSLLERRHTSRWTGATCYLHGRRHFYASCRSQQLRAPKPECDPCSGGGRRATVRQFTNYILLFRRFDNTYFLTPFSLTLFPDGGPHIRRRRWAIIFLTAFCTSGAVARASG